MASSGSGKASGTSSIIGITGSLFSGGLRVLPSPKRTIDLGAFIDAFKSKYNVEYEIKKPKIKYDKAPMELNYKMPSYGREKLPIFYSSSSDSRAYENINRVLGAYRGFRINRAYSLSSQNSQSSYNQPRSSRDSYKIQPLSYKQAEKYSMN